MRRNMQFAIAAFLALTVIISSCDTFKDEMTPGSYSETVELELSFNNDNSEE